MYGGDVGGGVRGDEEDEEGGCDQSGALSGGWVVEVAVGLRFGVDVYEVRHEI